MTLIRPESRPRRATASQSHREAYSTW